VIQPSGRQEQARIEKHSLKKERSLIVSNGITAIGLAPYSGAARTAFLYFGSISEQHGIVDVVKEYYASGAIHTPLYILGDGPLGQKLRDMIRDNHLEKVVHFLGYKTQKELVAFLADTPEHFIGIAPYKLTADGFNVHYADSLKLKEYVAFYLPFFTPAIMDIPVGLGQFGMTYATEQELAHVLAQPTLIRIAPQAEIDECIQHYSWDAVCARVPLL
jgi:glycosyltransferase involved in cell wall biosynthesis